MSSDYAKQLGAKLRAIRTQQGLSLHGVEEKSQGRWKAVVVGSYERGDRALTVQRLAELADFYGVPINELLPDGAPTAAATEPPPRLVLDLERLGDMPVEHSVDERRRVLRRQRLDQLDRLVDRDGRRHVRRPQQLVGREPQHRPVH